ncbi:MAG: hypothetical protein QM785_08185 [Pyrinomonadaceae bacterium]
MVNRAPGGYDSASERLQSLTGAVVVVLGQVCQGAAADVLAGGKQREDAKIPPLWDGRAAGRICDELVAFG